MFQYLSPELLTSGFIKTSHTFVLHARNTCATPTHARRHTHACTHVPIYHSARFYCLYYLVSELSFSSFLLGPTVLIYLRSQISTFYLSFSSYNVREERKVNCCGFTDGLKQVLLSTSFKLRGFSLEREKIVGFTLLRYTIVLRNSRHFSIQSEVKSKPIVTRARMISRAFCQLHVFTSSFDWFTGLCVLCDWLE